jgi:SRSO17 transposase
MHGRFAAWRVRPAPDLSARREPGPPCWLLAEWPEGRAGPTKFYFSNLPERSAVRTLVRAVATRWRTEQVYQQMKEELGLDHFEGRSCRGWHHHLTLVMLAHAFLVALRDDAAKRGDPSGPSPASRRPAG